MKLPALRRPENEPRRSLRREFSMIIFSVMSMAVVFYSAVLMTLSWLGWLDKLKFGILFPVLGMYLLSMLIAAILTLFVGNKILNPVVRLSRATGQVAAGNFSVRVKDDTDVSELQLAIRNFNAMVQELGATETLSNDFVANVSHEFKTPLAAIEGYAMLLQDHTLSDGERDEYVQKILFNSGRLSDLAGNILLLSKLENQTFDTQRTEFRLDEQIRQAVLLLEPKWTAKDLELDIELSPVIYYGNEGLLTQVWLNLVGNAVKFTPQGGTVRLRLWETGDGVTATVSDTGCGMSPEIQRHIFEKFYQGDASRRSEGNGLGLALCRRILDSCGGRISVDSAPGKGSSFTVALPPSPSPGRPA